MRVESDSTAPEDTPPGDDLRSTDSASPKSITVAAGALPPPSSKSNPKKIEALMEDRVLDVSGKTLEFDMLGRPEDESVQGLYLYKNEYSLVPRSVGRMGKLKTLKFFGNEVRLLPAQGLPNLVGLERLQVKVSASTVVDGLGLAKLQGLKELELSRVPTRPSVLPILSEVSGLKCLTKLSVCHFSIRYLPPEIGCLKDLEYLDLSFNKLKCLPAEISQLSSLISLKVSNNKLLEVPSCLSLLRRLENLDLSNNQLISLGSLELELMHGLQFLNLQNNKLVRCCEIPTWICCSLDGNLEDLSNDDPSSSLVEMDVYETSVPEFDMHSSFEGSHHAVSTLLGASPSSRNFAARRSTKRWKRRHYLQQRARQERLNNSRKWKVEGHVESLDNHSNESKNLDTLTPENETLDIGLDDASETVLCGVAEAESEIDGFDDDRVESECSVKGASLLLRENAKCGEDGSSSSETSKDADEVSCSESSKIIHKFSCNNGCGSNCKSKRHSEGELDNPKPYKCRRPAKEGFDLSRKYNEFSYCSIEDHLSDGFYDAGRDRPFTSLRNYEKNACLGSREVILLDRKKDEDLDATALSAQSLVYRMKRFECSTKEGVKVSVDDLQIASWLALFVSDHFGGSDRSNSLERTRKAVSGSNYRKPFVCTCSAGNNENLSALYNQNLNRAEHVAFMDVCEKSLQTFKAAQNSIIVPLGALQFGVCRHRALLMKYLCDRMEPPIPCELVRGYLDFFPHAWNAIRIKKGDSFVHMVVDACCPHDIREETDPEYFCRYIPLSRINFPLGTEDLLSLFPCFTGDDVDKSKRIVVQCKLGSVKAAAKIRYLEVRGNQHDDVRNFEYNFLGEVRILGVLRQHPSIIEIYGHQISSKWVSSIDGGPDQRVICAAIFSEFVEGGSLKDYIGKLSKAGKKQVPIDVAFCIAKDVACALMELHSKHIIHRDIKSENILIDLDSKRADGRPTVKLCDFDRAVPLRSLMHMCCISHRGNPPPNVCVGTPRWMAPEVLQAMKETKPYGLEVDIWSYGCLLLELLILEVPYFDVPELNIREKLEAGERPRLTDELETLASTDEPEDGSLKLGVLINLYRRCTKPYPEDRPTASEIYESLAI